MSGEPPTLPIDGSEITPDGVEAVYGRPVRAHVSASVLGRVLENREMLEQLLGQDHLYYGINTGFGSLCDRKIPPDQLESLQHNLLMSHAVGVGPPVPDEVVRLMMWFKIASLSRGHSGIRPEVVTLLAELLSGDALPVVPSKGSLGASGDLAPLAHLSLPLIGLGTVRQKERNRPAADALKELKLTPMRLAAKEGLALINGTQFMSAYGAALCLRARRLCKAADVLAGMSLEAVRGRLEPFDLRIHALRPSAGAMKSAHNVRELLAQRASNPGKPYGARVQEPYSLRCVPAVHGATRDALDHVEQVVYREINSVTDNPLVFEGAILSGGNFHGQPLALGLDYLAIAMAELGSISERRQYLLVNDHHYGLPVGLVAGSGLNSGLMIAHYTSAALTSENKVLCHPASVDTIPTSGGQEDHVSMGATAALKCWEVAGNVERMLGLELLIASQALDFTPATEIAPRVRKLRDFVRKSIAPLEADRVLQPDIETAIEMVRSQAVVQASEKQIGPL